MKRAALALVLLVSLGMTNVKNPSTVVTSLGDAGACYYVDAGLIVCPQPTNVIGPLSVDAGISAVGGLSVGGNVQGPLGYQLCLDNQAPFCSSYLKEDSSTDALIYSPQKVILQPGGLLTGVVFDTGANETLSGNVNAGGQVSGNQVDAGALVFAGQVCTPGGCFSALPSGSSVNGSGYNTVPTLSTQIVDAGTVIGNDFPAFDNGTGTTLYVATTGNDANACTSFGSPCLTIQGAVNKIPKLVEHQYTVLVSDGGYAAGAYLMGFQSNIGNYTPSSNTTGPGITIQCATGNAGLSGAMSGTVTSSTMGFVPLYEGWQGSTGPANWSTVTVTGAGWTINQLKGSMFCITSGPGQGQCPIILSNTATVASLVGTWPQYQPQGDSGYMIENWQTAVQAGLPKPPSGSGFNQYFPATQAQFGNAFMIGGNSAAPGFQYGYSWPWGNDGSLGNDGGSFTSPSMLEPFISISGCNFPIGDEQMAVGLTGTNDYVALKSNLMIDGGQFIQAAGGSNFIVLDNYLGGDAFGAFDIQRAGPGGFSIVADNYFPVNNSGGFTSVVFGTEGRFYLLQNYFLQTDRAKTEEGFQYSYTGQAASLSSSLSSGNEFDGLAFGVDFRQNGRLTSVNDDFENNSGCMQVQGGSFVQMGVAGAGEGATGSNNVECFQVSSSTLVLGNANSTTTTVNFDAGYDAGQVIFVSDQFGNSSYSYSDIGVAQPIVEWSQGFGLSSTVY